MQGYPRKKGHLILPAVESWGTNMNILKDPPKSIHTRRIDKALDSNIINELIDGSGDRVNEMIKVYARGVNPMVSVSYNNVGNNGGQNIPNGNNIVNGSLQNTRVTQNSAPLTYKILDEGAFRPPIRSQYDLLPLSRLPRTHIEDTMTSKSFIDWEKSRPIPPPLTKTVELKQLLQAYQPIPKKIVNIEKPLELNFKMLDKINDKHINISADAGKSTLDKFDRDNWDSEKHIEKIMLDTWAETNKNQTKVANLENINMSTDKYIHDVLPSWAETNKNQTKVANLEDINMDTDKYIHDVLPSWAETNKNQTKVANLEDINMDTDKYIQNALQYEIKSGSEMKPGKTFIGDMGEPLLNNKMITTNVYSNKNDSRVNKNILHENELVYDKNIPSYDMNTQQLLSGTQSFNSMNLNSRTYERVYNLDKGSFEMKPTIPSKNREEMKVRTGNSERDKMREFVNEQQFSRNKVFGNENFINRF